MMNIRNLVALYITIIMLPLCITVLAFCGNMRFNYDDVSEEIVLNELRETLLFSYDMEVSDYSLSFTYKEKGYELSLVNDKLLLQPGTQIIVYGVDDISFYVDNGCVYLRYSKEGKDYEKVLCKEERLYIDDFSHCDDERDSTDLGDEQLYSDG